MITITAYNQAHQHFRNAEEILQQNLPIDLFNLIKTVAGEKMSHYKSVTSRKLKDKYLSLCLGQQQTQYNPHWVKNLSSRHLDENETRVLSKGLNYATDYTNKDVLQFIAQIEPVIEDIRDITTDERGQLRQQIISSINSAKKTNNLSYDERQAINRLKNDEQKSSS